MSVAPNSTADETPEPLPPDRSDGWSSLDLRETLQTLFKDPDVRNFTFAALGALGMIFLILFQQNSDVGGLLVVIVGICGVLLRWPAAPVFVVLLVMYFQWTPSGIPGDGFENGYEIVEGRFRVTDMLLVMSVVVYLSCQYRLFGLVSQAIAFEGPIRSKDESPIRRPPVLIQPAELAILLGATAAIVVFGQLVWWFANAVEVAPAENFPLQWASEKWSIQVSGRERPEPPVPGGLSPGATRFVVLVGLLFFGTLLARLVFGYWRLRAMGASEGRMILLDNGWSETSRERQRIEKWRVWGRKRAEVAEKVETGEKS